MKHLKSLMILATAMVTVVASFAQVMADPLPGQFLKFQQKPMDATSVDGQLYWGHDELSTIYGTHGDPAAGIQASYTIDGVFMADDFADEFDTPVVHVRWWGSYLSNSDLNGRVPRFLISFETDVPADPLTVPPTPFSHPGVPLLNQVSDRDADGILTPGSGTFTEKPISLGGFPLDETLYEYNAELACPFNQDPDTVYWLKIVALVDPVADGAIRWGWHNRDYTAPNPLASGGVLPGEIIDGTTPGGTDIYHFQDDAVSGVIDPVIVISKCNVFTQQFNYNPENYMDDADGPGIVAGSTFAGISKHSKDLAFELYTIPEPSTFIMILIGAVTFGIGYGSKRKR